jgi:purine nucleosidase
MFIKRLYSLIGLLVLLAGTFAAGPYAAAAERRPVTKIWVDTDAGVDDAVAIALLLKAPNAAVLGFSTVAGNASVENATNNVLTVLDVAGRQAPVTIGAAAPLVFRPSLTGMFAHGPDGLWFAQRPHDLTGIPRDAPAAIAAAARANPGMTLLTLGPLTNVAEALRRYPAEMRTAHIVALAGTRGPGNSTPVSEFNAWFDPQALDAVLESGADVTLVTMDAWNAVTVDPTAFTQALAQSGDPLARFLAAPLGYYFAVQTQSGATRTTIPDAVAAVYALRPQIGAAQSGLVDVATDNGLTRGQTVMAFTPIAKVSMIANDDELSALVLQFFSQPGFDINMALGAILARRPDNAKVVLAVKGASLEGQVLRVLNGRGGDW